MAKRLSRKLIQTDVYEYLWTRDKGDGEYAGKLDIIKVDKDEGYEVLYFIQEFLRKHGLPFTENIVHMVEDILQSPELSFVVMRDELEEAIEKELDL